MQFLILLFLILLALLVLWRLCLRLGLRPRLYWWLGLRRTIGRLWILRSRRPFVLSWSLDGVRILRRLARLHRVIYRRLRGRTIIPRWRLDWMIRLRRIHFRTVVRLYGRVIIARRRLKWPIRLRQPIRRLTLRRLTGWWLIQLRVIRWSYHRTLVRILIRGPICGLICGRVRRLISRTGHVWCWGWCCRFRRRRHPHDGLRCERSSWLQALHLLPSHGLAGMLGEHLLFCSKRYGSRRRSGFGDHRTREHRARGSCHPIVGSGTRSHDRSLSRRHRDSGVHRRSSDLLAG